MRIFNKVYINILFLTNMCAWNFMFNTFVQYRLFCERHAIANMHRFVYVCSESHVFAFLCLRKLFKIMEKAKYEVRGQSKKLCNPYHWLKSFFRSLFNRLVFTCGYTLLNVVKHTVILVILILRFCNSSFIYKNLYTYIVIYI